MAYISYKGLRFGGHNSFSPGTPMTDEDIARVAPSVFATQAHDSRSERFAYVSTGEILAGLRKAGFQPVAAIQGRSRVEGKADFTKHMLRFQHPDYVTAGVAAPQALLMNAHDGTSSYRMMSGVFRSICTNSMIVMEEGGTDFRVKHSGNVTEKVIEGTFSVIDESVKTIAKVENWQSIALTDREKLVFADAAHLIRFGDADGEVTTPIEATQLLRVRRDADKADNLWAVFNRVQENAVKGGLRAWGMDSNGQRRRYTSKEVAGIDGNVKLNRALWQLADSMAKLKAA